MERVKDIICLAIPRIQYTIELGIGHHTSTTVGLLHIFKYLEDGGVSGVVSRGHSEDKMGATGSSAVAHWVRWTGWRIASDCSKVKYPNNISQPLLVCDSLPGLTVGRF